MISVVNATGNLTCFECAQSTLGTVDGDKSGNCFNEDSTTPFRISCDACYIRKWFLNLFNQNFQISIIKIFHNDLNRLKVGRQLKLMRTARFIS